MLESVLRDIADAESNRALATAARTPRPVAVTARNSQWRRFKFALAAPTVSRGRPPEHTRRPRRLPLQFAAGAPLDAGQEPFKLCSLKGNLRAAVHLIHRCKCSPGPPGAVPMRLGRS